MLSLCFPSYRTVERNRRWPNNSTGIYACEYDELLCYTKSMWWRTRWRSFKHVSILCQFSICASVNTSEIFCCFSTGLRFFGGFLGSFSWTKQNLVGIDPGLTLAQEEPGFFVKHSALKWSLHILECSFTGVFVRRIFARHLDSNYLFCSGKTGKRCQDFLTSMPEEFVQP